MSKKILIVDDDALTTRLLTSRLEAAGYCIVTAENGADALKCAVWEKPDVVIMDIMLPDMQGSDVVKLIQTNSGVPKNLKIIFLSGIISQADDLDQRIQVGGQNYPAVAKPIDFEQLLSFIVS
jgi:DNA-binding response OmpR family regulator